jgi:hypothetical protein
MDLICCLLRKLPNLTVFGCRLRTGAAIALVGQCLDHMAGSHGELPTGVGA